MLLNLPCLAALVASVLAAPVDKRANTLPPVDSATDESVLQLALYLEHLELALYTGGYENFTDAEYTAAGFPPGFRDNVGVIAQVCCFTSFILYSRPGANAIYLTARSHPRRNHQRHPREGRLYPCPVMQLQIPGQLPHFLCRSSQYDHLRRHWRISWWCRTHHR